MFTVGTDKSISVTRGDSCSFVAPIDYALKNGDVLRLKVFRKKACEDVVLQKDFAITTTTNTVTIELTEKDTRIGKVISKPVDYWYEIELNPDNNPTTLLGYDEDGAKIFRLYPEGRDLEDDELIKEEQETFRQLTEEFLEQNFIIHAILILVSNYYYLLLFVKKVIRLLLHRHHWRICSNYSNFDI